MKTWLLAYCQVDLFSPFVCWGRRERPHNQEDMGVNIGQTYTNSIREQSALSPEEIKKTVPGPRSYSDALVNGSETLDFRYKYG